MLVSIQCCTWAYIYFIKNRAHSDAKLQGQRRLVFGKTQIQARSGRGNWGFTALGWDWQGEQKPVTTHWYTWHESELSILWSWIKRRCRDWILIFCASGPDLLTSLLQTAEQLRCNWVPCSNPPKPPTTTQAQLLSLLENFVCFPLRQELLNFWPRNLATCSNWFVLSAWSCLEVVLTSNSDNSRGWFWQLENIEFLEARSYTIVPLVRL